VTTIQVTQDDIDDGIRGSYCDCPIALAIKRQFPGKEIIVSKYILGIGGVNTWNVPKPVYNFIDRFDNGNPVEPIVFEIDETPFLSLSGS
jgi:hypothetical protein